MSSDTCVDHYILVLKYRSNHYAFHNKRFQTLFKDQLVRSKATCSFKQCLNNIVETLPYLHACTYWSNLPPTWSCFSYQTKIMYASNHFADRNQTILFCQSRFGYIDINGSNSRCLHHDKGLLELVSLS